MRLSMTAGIGRLDTLVFRKKIFARGLVEILKKYHISADDGVWQDVSDAEMRSQLSKGVPLSDAELAAIRRDTMRVDPDWALQMMWISVKDALKRGNNIYNFGDSVVRPSPDQSKREADFYLEGAAPHRTA